MAALFVIPAKLVPAGIKQEAGSQDQHIISGSPIEALGDDGCGVEFL